VKAFIDLLRVLEFQSGALDIGAARQSLETCLSILLSLFLLFLTSHCKDRRDGVHLRGLFFSDGQIHSFTEDTMS